MFETFTYGARRVIFYGLDEALEQGSKEIKPEHLLLGVARASTALVNQFGIPREKIKTAIRELSETHPKFHKSIDIPLSKDSQRIIMAYARQEGENLDSKGVVDLRTLFTAIIRDALERPESITGIVVKNAGIKLENVREEVLQNRASRIAAQKGPSLDPEVGAILIQAFSNAEKAGKPLTLAMLKDTIAAYEAPPPRPGTETPTPIPQTPGGTK